MKDGAFKILYNHYKVRKGTLTRGAHSWIGPAILDLTGDITVGAHSNISGGVQIFTHQHKWNHSRGLRKKIQKIVPVDLVVGVDVYIGVSAIILAVSKIGDGATIGAGSVLTKDVPAYETWAGNPAKRIGKRDG